MTQFKYLAVDMNGEFFIYDILPERTPIGQWVSKDGEWKCVGWRKTQDTYEDELDSIPKEYRQMTYEDEPVQVMVEIEIKILKKIS